jgi:hypothetical protein
MYDIVFTVFIVFVWQITRESICAAFRKIRAPKPEPLCRNCFYAHMQYAANARRAISCTYGGAVRPMRLDVLYCTDYRTRTLPIRTVAVGFVREIAPAE